MPGDPFASALRSFLELEETVKQTVEQAPDEPEVPLLHRRDATALAVERLFRLHGFPVAEWVRPLLEGPQSGTESPKEAA